VRTPRLFEGSHFQNGFGRGSGSRSIPMFFHILRAAKVLENLPLVLFATWGTRQLYGGSSSSSCLAFYLLGLSPTKKTIPMDLHEPPTLGLVLGAYSDPHTGHDKLALSTLSEKYQ
jgi:hypothetical protein